MSTDRTYEYFPWPHRGGFWGEHDNLFDDWWEYAGGGGGEGGSGGGEEETTESATREISIDCLWNNQAFIYSMMLRNSWDMFVTMINQGALMNAGFAELQNRLNTMQSELNNKPRVGLNRLVPASVDENDIEVFVAKGGVDQKNTGEFNYNITRVNDNVYELDLSSSDLEVEDYSIIIRPKRVDSKVKYVQTDIEQSSVIGLQDNMFSPKGPPNYSTNELFGWNFALGDGKEIRPDSQMVIVGNEVDFVNNSIMAVKVSPAVPGYSKIVANDNVFIWKDSFIPIVIDLKIVEHDEESLSFSLYEKQTTNCTTGEIKIYDGDGNVFKTFNCHSTEENGEQIKVRDPVE